MFGLTNAPQLFSTSVTGMSGPRTWSHIHKRRYYQECVKHALSVAHNALQILRHGLQMHVNGMLAICMGTKFQQQWRPQWSFSARHYRRLQTICSRLHHQCVCKCVCLCVHHSCHEYTHECGDERSHVHNHSCRGDKLPQRNKQTCMQTKQQTNKQNKQNSI